MCRIASCKREAATFCYHCQQDVCHTHFSQHSSMVMTDVYSLADQINTLTDNIKTFSTEQMRKNLFDQLQRWRNESITLIEQMYKRKQIELNEKIGQLDKTLSVVKVNKQQEISQIKEKITELTDAGEATFDQVNRLRQLVNNIALDVDKLRIPTIRIETQPANLDTCQIIDVHDVRYTKPRDFTMLMSDTGINDDDRQFNRSPDHFHPLTRGLMTTRGNSGPTLSDPDFDPRMPPYLPYVPMPMLISLPPYPPPNLLPVPPQMLVTESSKYRPSGPMEREPPHFIASAYPPLPSTPPTDWPLNFSYMSQRPKYLKRDSSEDSSE
jgi:hypothetical protein